MSREPCPYQDARAFQYAFVAGVLRVEYLKEALQQRRPALQGVAPFVTIHVTTREGFDARRQKCSESRQREVLLIALGARCST